jgi:hypothetical protein
MSNDYGFVADVLKAKWTSYHEEFNRRIGRKALANDVIACPDRLNDSKDLREGMQFLIACNAPPQIVFAYEATGRMPIAAAMVELKSVVADHFAAAIEQYFTLRLAQLAASDQKVA